MVTHPDSIGDRSLRTGLGNDINMQPQLHIVQQRWQKDAPVPFRLANVLKFTDPEDRKFNLNTYAELKIREASVCYLRNRLMACQGSQDPI